MWLVSCKGDSQPLLAGPLAVVAGQQQQQQLQLLLSSKHCLDFRAGVCLPELYLHSGSTCIFRLAVHHGADRQQGHAALLPPLAKLLLCSLNMRIHLDWMYTTLVDAGPG
jgi:hypothetical protein